MNIPTISLKQCQKQQNFNNGRMSLYLASEHFAGTFPKQFFVESHHTGRVVRFLVIGPEDELFNPDQWDGEMQIYRPVGDEVDTKVDYLVVQHEW